MDFSLLSMSTFRPSASTGPSNSITRIRTLSRGDTLMEGQIQLSTNDNLSVAQKKNEKLGASLMFYCSRQTMLHKRKQRQQ